MKRRDPVEAAMDRMYAALPKAMDVIIAAAKCGDVEACKYLIDHAMGAPHEHPADETCEHCGEVRAVENRPAPRPS